MGHSPFSSWTQELERCGSKIDANTKTHHVKRSHHVKHCGSETDVNPNPHNVKIGNSTQIGHCLVVEAIYPDCTNFEGNKILVYDGVNIEDLKVQMKMGNGLDPHFSQDTRLHYPIARFVPTMKGLRMARCFAAEWEVVREH